MSRVIFRNKQQYYNWLLGTEAYDEWAKYCDEVLDEEDYEVGLDV